MTRRELIYSAAAVGFTGRSRAAETSFPGTQYREYWRCLPDYLRALAADAYSRRNRALQSLTSAAAVKQRQKWAEETFWRLVGGQPDRTPLHIQEVGGFDRSGYRLRKLVYQSQPELYVPANLYIPTGTPPFPGVLFQMGHTLNGKAGDSYQKCCQGLARLGYVVLAFDPIGQGERIQYPDATGTRTRLRSADDEHTNPGRQMLLVGDTITRVQVWDAVRSLDVLAAHPAVDPKRLASTGQSGGATVTMLLAAIDDRLAAGAVCSGNTENLASGKYNPPGSTDDAEQDFIDGGPAGFDRWDLFYPFAPKPMLITASDKDSFGTYSPEYLSNGWEEFQKLKRVYEVLGKPENLAWADTPLPHGLSYDSRLHVYNWFERHLKGSSKKISEEPTVTPEPDKTIWVSDKGSVTVSFGSQTPFGLTRSRTVDKIPAPLASILRLDRPSPRTRMSVLSKVPSRGLEIQAVEIPSADKVWLPAWLFVPTVADKTRPVMLMLNSSGRNVHWQEGQTYQQLAARGYVVCAADVRGIGDLTPEYGRGAAGYQRSHQTEEDYAWASMMLGKPLLGQRVTDILALVAGLHAAFPGSQVQVNANGQLTVPALCAAADDKTINALYLAGGLVSFQSILQTEQYTVPFANFCPSILKYTDLPLLASQVAPRPIVIAGSIDAAGNKLDPSSVRQAYADAVAKGHVTISSDADWSFQNLLA